MADNNFLAHFIEEPVYVIASEEQLLPESKEVETKVDSSPTPILDTPVYESAVNTVEEPAAPVYVKPLPTSGNNLKHCIVLVESDEELLEESLKELLLKIMGAVKRTAEDILITNCKNADSDQIEALLANNNHRHILSFGTDILANLKGADFYTIQKEGAISMLKSDPLSEISRNVDKKKALWKALQEMFL